MLCSIIRSGKGRKVEPGVLVGIGLVGGVLIMLLGIIFAGPVLSALNTPESVIPEAKVYIRIYLLSLLQRGHSGRGSGCAGKLLAYSAAAAVNPDVC